MLEFRVLSADSKSLAGTPNRYRELTREHGRYLADANEECVAVWISGDGGKNRSSTNSTLSCQAVTCIDSDVVTTHHDVTRLNLVGVTEDGAIATELHGS